MIPRHKWVGSLHFVQLGKVCIDFCPPLWLRSVQSAQDDGEVLEVTKNLRRTLSKTAIPMLHGVLGFCFWRYVWKAPRRSCLTEHAVRLGKLRVVDNNQRVFRLDRLLRSTWCPIFHFTAYCLKNRDSQRKPRPNCVKSTTYILKSIWCHVSTFANRCKHLV